MKFIHIADVHLGASPDAGKAYSKSRTQEIWDSFAHITEVCREESAEVLLIAGDLFHRQPLLRELKEVNYLLSEIPDTKVVLVAGNHDYLKVNSYYRTFVWADNVHMILSENVSSVEFPELGLAVYGLSYEKKEITESRYHYAQAQGKQPCEILIAHGGDEKHIPIQKNKIVSLGYDYIAMGHIHKHWEPVRRRAIYPGALEPVDKNDLGPHGYIIGEINEGEVSTEFVPCAMREYVPMEVEVSPAMTGYQLREKMHSAMEARGMQKIYKVTVTGLRDPDVIFDLEQMDVFGNVVEFIDSTKPAYDFEKIKEQNQDNLLGKLIGVLGSENKDSVEYMAMCEGVHALLETRRGQE